MDQIEVREGARRQHRGLAMFCALYCWHHNKEAVFVSKELFLDYLGLERMKGARYDWVLEDFSEYFPFIFKRNLNGRELIVFSKIPEDDLLKEKEKAINFSPKILDLAKYPTMALFDGGTEAQCFINDTLPFLSEIKNLNEYAISNVLPLLAGGVVSPGKALE